MMSKIRINGKYAHPGFKYLKLNSSLNGGSIKGNFNKFLLNEKGRVRKHYGSLVHPDDIEEAIIDILFV
jgi:glutathione peroxidase